MILSEGVRALRRVLIMGLAALPLVTCLGPALSAQAAGPPAITGESAVLEDLTTGQILYAKNANLSLPPASITKIMTALLALKYGPPLSEEISVPREAQGVPGSSVYLVAGQKMTFRDLLYGLLLRSGNDAAVAVAILTAGSVPRFVRMMNAECAALGCTHTHFANPHGLQQSGHYVSARDMALIARAAMDVPEFRRIVSTKTYPFPGYPKPFTLINQNRLLWTYPGATGVKIGFTNQARETIVASAQRGDLDLATVVLHTTERSRWTDSAALLSWGFANFTQVTVLKKGEVVGHARTASGKRITLVSNETVPWIVARGTRPATTVRLDVPALHAADIRRGEALGTASVEVDGKKIATVTATAATSVIPPASDSWVMPLAAALVVFWALLRLRRRKRRRSLQMYRYRANMSR